MAAGRGRVEDAKAFIYAGADMNYADTRDERRGWTPMHYAAWKGRTATCGALQRMGADIHAVDQYNATALHYAAERHAILFGVLP